MTRANEVNDVDVVYGGGGVDSALVRRAPRISQLDVVQAADALLLEGHRPTIDRVRMRLGRGSPNTIQEHLDVWWTHLGSRLRDVPGQEFPQLPERVAHALQVLWNEALDSAHAALGEKISTREHAVAERESALDARTQKMLEQEQTTVARATALEESVALARDQLLAANQRADRLETTLQVREAECARLQTRIDDLEADAIHLRSKLDVAATARNAERTQLEERHAATEARWLNEVDRARQSTKETVKEQERQCKELRAQIHQLQAQRDELKRDLQEVRSELRTVTAVRARPEKRLKAVARISGKARQMAGSNLNVRRKRQPLNARPRRSGVPKRKGNDDSN